MTYIYLIENCYNNPNNVYIGKTKSPDIREYHHKRIYGNQIKFNVIDQVDSLIRKDWEPLESYWLEQFRQWGFKVVNNNKKGGGGMEYWTDEMKIKLKNNKERGKKISATNKGRLSPIKGKKLSEGHKAKIKAKRGHLLGRKNT
jgi:predicted mannosyl-3-phosphoglycerate phosphatase (HAD superfamily)